MSSMEARDVSILPNSEIGKFYAEFLKNDEYLLENFVFK